MLWVTTDHFVPALNHICVEIWILHHSEQLCLSFGIIISQLNQHQGFLTVLSELFSCVKEIFLCSAKSVLTLCHLTSIFPGGFQVPCQICREWVSFKPLFDVTLLLLIFSAVYGNWLRHWLHHHPPAELLPCCSAWPCSFDKNSSCCFVFALAHRLTSELAVIWLMSLMK